MFYNKRAKYRNWNIFKAPHLCPSSFQAYPRNPSFTGSIDLRKRKTTRRETALTDSLDVTFLDFSSIDRTISQGENPPRQHYSCHPLFYDLFIRLVLTEAVLNTITQSRISLRSTVVLCITALILDEFLRFPSRTLVHSRICPKYREWSNEKNFSYAVTLPKLLRS
jgi:hypothetical protein